MRAPYRKFKLSQSINGDGANPIWPVVWKNQRYKFAVRDCKFKQNHAIVLLQMRRTVGAVGDFFFVVGINLKLFEYS